MSHALCAARAAWQCVSGYTRSTEAARRLQRLAALAALAAHAAAASLVVSHGSKKRATHLSLRRLVFDDHFALC